MSSFSCPHLDTKETYCIRLKKECIPGRVGCVLKGRFIFAVPAEKRITEKEQTWLKDNSNSKKKKNK